MIINDERNAIENTKESLSNLIIAITVYAHTHTHTQCIRRTTVSMMFFFVLFIE